MLKQHYIYYTVLLEKYQVLFKYLMGRMSSLIESLSFKGLQRFLNTSSKSK